MARVSFAVCFGALGFVGGMYAKNRYHINKCKQLLEEAYAQAELGKALRMLDSYRSKHPYFEPLIAAQRAYLEEGKEFEATSEEKKIHDAFSRSKRFFNDLADLSDSVGSLWFSFLTNDAWKEIILEKPGRDTTLVFLDVGQHLDKLRCHKAGYKRGDGSNCSWCRRYSDGRPNQNPDRPEFYVTIEKWFDVQCEVCPEESSAEDAKTVKCYTKVT